MTTRDGQQMFLSNDAEDVARQLYEAGASFTSGHRDIGMQADAMAENIVTSGNRQWIAQTYLCPGPLQEVVDAHPEATTVWALASLLHDGLHGMDEQAVARLSHHLAMPCNVMDIDPNSVTADLEALIDDLRKQGKIVKLILVEGGLVRCHIECASLPLNKVVMV